VRVAASYQKWRRQLPRTEVECFALLGKTLREERCQTLGELLRREGIEAKNWEGLAAFIARRGKKKAKR
jgi:hypothetical protein